MKKKSYEAIIVRSLIFLLLTVTSACGHDDDNSSNTNNPIVNPGQTDSNEGKEEPKVFDNVVEFEADNVAYVECDTARGTYIITFKDRGCMPKIKMGSVVPVNDHGVTRIVLVTKADINGNKAELRGCEGDLSYVFHDTKFTLTTNKSKVAGTSGCVYAPHRIGSTRATDMVYDPDEPITLFDKQYTIRSTAKFNARQTAVAWYSYWKGNEVEDKDNDKNDSIAVEYDISPRLDLRVDFEFGSPVEEWYDGVKFLRAGNYNAEFTLLGNIEANSVLEFGIREAYSKRLKGDDNGDMIMLEHNFFGNRFVAFTIPGVSVPVMLMFMGDIFMQGGFSTEGKLHVKLTNGINSFGAIGVAHDIKDGEEGGFRIVNGFDSNWKQPALTVDGSAKLNADFCIFPVFQMYIYGLFGPAIAIKPVLKSELGFGFRTDLLNTDYDTSNYIGIDGEIKGDLQVAVDVVEPVIFSSDMYLQDFDPFLEENLIEDVSIFRTPSDIIITKQSQNSVVKDEPIDISFEVKADLCGVPVRTSVPCFVKLTSRETNKYALVKRGVYDYTWTPVSNDDYLRICLCDYQGKEIKTISIGQPVCVRNISPEDGFRLDANRGRVDFEWEDDCATAGKNIYDIYIGETDNFDEMIKIGAYKAKECAFKPTREGTYYWCVVCVQPDGKKIRSNITRFFYGKLDNYHEAVDLGLSVKWATMNIGASSPEDYGDYFAWGETEPKTTFDWSNYKWCNGSHMALTKYCFDSTFGIIDGKTILESTDDAATVKWGNNWRMPTMAEQAELLENCIWTWTTRNGVNGYDVASKKNGNTIFLPAAGCRDLNDLSGVGSNGFYWSSSIFSTNTLGAYGLYFVSYDMCNSFDGHQCGRSVRAVCP